MHDRDLVGGKQHLVVDFASVIFLTCQHVDPAATETRGNRRRDMHVHGVLGRHQRNSLSPAEQFGTRPRGLRPQGGKLILLRIHLRDEFVEVIVEERKGRVYLLRP
jgi:hypothetical protein